MMLKTSSVKRNPAINLFRFTLRKNIGLLILVTVGMLLVCPGYILIHINSALKNNAAVNYDLTNLIRLVSVFITVAAAGTAVLLNVINFMYLYAKRSGDVFHAIPVTRTELLLARTGAGLAFSVIPMVLSYAALAAVSLMPRVNGSLKTILINLAYSVMITLLCSAFSLIFIICAGTALDLILSFVGIGAGMILIGVIIYTMCGSMLTGFNYSDPSVLLCILSPFCLAFCGMSDFLSHAPEFTVADGLFFVKAAILTAAFLIVAALLYNRRRAEHSGESYAYRFIYLLCSLVISFVGAFGVGTIFAGGQFGAVYWIFAVLGGILVAVTFGAITNRGFKSAKKSILIGCCSLAAMGVLTLVLQSGCFGFSARIPAVKDIESVTVRYSNEEIVFKDPQKVLSLHGKLVKNLDTIKKTDYYSNRQISYVYLNYTLKDKEIFSREFRVANEDFAEELLEIYKSDERIQGIFNTLKSDQPSMINISGFAQQETLKDEYISTAVSVAEFKKIMEAYALDVKNATTDSVIMKNISSLDVNWDYGQDYHMAYGSRYYNLFLESSFSKTRAVLDSLNLIARTWANYGQSDKYTQ